MRFCWRKLINSNSDWFFQKCSLKIYCLRSKVAGESLNILYNAQISEWLHHNITQLTSFHKRITHTQIQNPPPPPTPDHPFLTINEHKFTFHWTKIHLFSTATKHRSAYISSPFHCFNFITFNQITSGSYIKIPRSSIDIKVLKRTLSVVRQPPSPPPPSSNIPLVAHAICLIHDISTSIPSSTDGTTISYCSPAPPPPHTGFTWFSYLFSFYYKILKFYRPNRKLIYFYRYDMIVQKIYKVT